tara:strand:+ start:414 stop:668 length:255 start_codon:yes stop_codon:yes gene_type:complete
MTELEKQFEEATILVKTLKNKPDNKTLLELYSLYKVATIGVNNTSKPWAVQLEARAKWDAWKSKDSLTKHEAMKEYIRLVDSLV